MKRAAKEEEKKCKALEREAKKVEAQQKRKDQSTRKRPSKSSTKNCSKRRSVDEGLQHHEILPNECAACFALWKEDDTDEWLKCTNSDCGVWCHADYLEQSEQAFVCVLCQTYFV